MARKVVETILDDIDGSEGASTVTFAFDGKSYEVDLSDKNRDKLAKALEPYISAGRTTSSARRSSGGTSRSSNKAELQKIREWANANGHSVSERGRIPASIVEAYEAASK